MCVHLLGRALKTNGTRNSAAREQRHYGKFYLKSMLRQIIGIAGFENCCRNEASIADYTSCRLLSPVYRYPDIERDFN